MEERPGVYGDFPRRQNNPMKAAGIFVIVLMALAILVGPPVVNFLSLTQSRVYLDSVSDEFSIDPELPLDIYFDFDMGSVIMETSTSDTIGYTLDIFGRETLDLSDADEMDYSTNSLQFVQLDKRTSEEFRYELTLTIPTTFPELDIQMYSGVGDLDIDLSGYHAIIEAELRTSVGGINLYINNATVDFMSLDSSTGGIDLELVDSVLRTNIMAETSTGSIDITLVDTVISSQRQLILSSSTGSIDVDITQHLLGDDLLITADLSTGNFRSDITRTDSVGTRYDASSSTGSVDLPDENNVNPAIRYDVSVSTGNVDISEIIVGT